MPVKLARAWYCIWADHNGHTGCNTDMLWLSDLYDYITGFGSLVAIAAFLAIMAHDKWRTSRSEFWANTVALAVMLIIGCIGAVAAITLGANR
jgi:hypothetical protein